MIAVLGVSVAFDVFGPGVGNWDSKSDAPLSKVKIQ